MNRGFHRRLGKTAAAVGNKPYRHDAIDQAYATFLRTGELPEDRALSWYVLERALCARKEAADKRVYTKCVIPPDKPTYMTGPPREQVFKEAAHESDVARKSARMLIRMLVREGCDPTDVEFIPADASMPEFGGVAMHLLGWPDKLVRPPYEAQMQRVMRQHADVRAQSPRTDGWYREAAAALAAFMNGGVLPEDDLLRRFALTVTEMFAIHADYFGKGDAGTRATVLAAFEAAANATPEERDAALRQLGTLQPKAAEAWHDARS